MSEPDTSGGNRRFKPYFPPSLRFLTIVSAIMVTAMILATIFKNQSRFWIGFGVFILIVFALLRAVNSIRASEDEAIDNQGSTEQELEKLKQQRKLNSKKAKRHVRVKRLYAEHVSQEEQAEILGVHLNTIKRDWKELGLKGKP